MWQHVHLVYCRDTLTVGHVARETQPPLSTQRTRKRMVLLGLSNFLMADIVSSNKHTSGITRSCHSHFTFIAVAFL